MFSYSLNVRHSDAKVFSKKVLREKLVFYISWVIKKTENAIPKLCSKLIKVICFDKKLKAKFSKQQSWNLEKEMTESGPFPESQMHQIPYYTMLLYTLPTYAMYFKNFVQ